jgi:hypothetical protein
LGDAETLNQENGTAKPSMMSRLYTEQLPDSEVPEPGLLHNEGKLEDAAKNSAAAAYSAGADTVCSLFSMVTA